MARAGLEQRLNDLRDLLRSLAFRQDRFRRSLPKLSMSVDSREPEIAERQHREAIHCIGRRNLATVDCLEQGL